MLTFTNTKKTGPTIALCVIARNEADMIADCLDSVKGFVDETVVVDTGSTDRTVEIAEAHGARVEHFEWINDFAAARNYAIECATADWILMLDADERLAPESGQFVRQAVSNLPTGYFGFCVQIENRVGERGMSHYMTRLFPRHPDLRFVGAIHEELRPASPTLGTIVMQAPMVRLLHYGYEPEVYRARGKDERNMRLLEQELEQNPDSARLMYYVLQQHVAQRRYEQALPYTERFMAHKSQLRPAFEVEVTRMRLEALHALGRWDEATGVLEDAEKSHAVSSYAYEMVANHELLRDRTAAALEYYVRARDPQLPDGLWCRPQGEEWQLRTKIADCRWTLGRHRRALAELEQALPEIPDNTRPVVALTAIHRCLRVNLFAAAYRWAMKAHDLAADDDLKLQLEIVDLVNTIPPRTSRTGAFAALDRAVVSENWQAVYDLARTLPLEGSAVLARLLRIATQLSDEGAQDAALDLLERALDAWPREPRVYWNLARTLNALERHAEAADALSVLESLPDAETLLQAA